MRGFTSILVGDSFFRALFQVRCLESWRRPAPSWVSRQSSPAQTNLTPDAALQELLAGNQRFAANQLTSIEHDLTILKAHTVDKQEPCAAVLSCADSRVPVELIFDQTIGQIFVTRLAGNIVTPEIIASLNTELQCLA
jgi:Carbonic anhydrase